MDKPIRFEIEVKKVVIRVMKDITTDEEYAQLVLISDDGKEHTLGYHSGGHDYNCYISSPEDGKLTFKVDHEDID